MQNLNMSIVAPSLLAEDSGEEVADAMEEPALAGDWGGADATSGGGVG